MESKRVISFDPESHTYRDENLVNYISVTTLINKVVPKYDSEFWAIYRVIEQAGIYKPRPFPEERAIEVKYGNFRTKMSIDKLKSGILPTMTKHESVLNDWKIIAETACEDGSKTHNVLEDSINMFSGTEGYTFNTLNSQPYAYKITNIEQLKNSPLKNKYPKIYKSVSGLIEKGFTLYAELRVYSSVYNIAGTIDLLAVKNKEFYIIDWKTNRKPLKFESGYYKKVWTPDRTKKVETKDWVTTYKNLLKPLDYVQDCKGSIYTLQLSSYAFICELWGWKFLGAYLFHIRPKTDEYGEIIYDEEGLRKELEPEVYKIPYWVAAVKSLFEFHKQS